MIDWTVIGQVGGMILSGVVGWFASKGKRQVTAAQDSAQISDYRADQATTDAAAKQVSALMDRVTALETSHAELWQRLQDEVAKRMKLQFRVLQLEGVLKSNSIDVPPELP
jgi:hypothetical protein